MDDASPSLPEYIRVDHRGFCWWCGQLADSREHKYKRSDAVGEFGGGAWRDPIVRVTHGGKEQRIQGPNSQGLKFGRSLCRRCNNARSSPFDESYAELMLYVSDNESLILNKERFLQSTIFGRHWKEKRDDVLRFLIKHVGCRLAEERLAVPRSFDRFLDGADRRPSGVAICLNVRLDIVEWERHLREMHGEVPGSLWLGEIDVRYDSSTQSLTYASSHMGVGPVRFSYEVFFDHRRPVTNLARNKVRVPLLRNVPSGLFAAECADCKMA